MSSGALDVLSNEQMASKLTEFGLSLNQAKVYLSVVLSKITTASKISDETRLYRQDIYKIIPILQKKGLLTKIIAKPIKFEALPVEKAIDALILEYEKEWKDKQARLKSTSEALKSEIVKWQSSNSVMVDDTKFSLLTTDSEIRNKSDVSFENTQKEFNVVTTPVLASRILTILKERIKSLVNRNVVTRVLIENPARDFAKSKRILNGLGYLNSEYFMVKQFFKESMMPYRVFDGKEVWIMLCKETETGQPCFLWTTSPNIVRFYEENFYSLWNDPSAEKL